MRAVRKTLPTQMTVEEFLVWPGDGTPYLHQLVDGEVRAMASPSTVHGAIQGALAGALFNHLTATRRDCQMVVAPGVVPRVRSKVNMRVPDLAVTCTPLEEGQRALPAPVLLIEILSPSNERETWEAVWTYTTIPTVQEILIVESTKIAAHLLRRGTDGNWPEQPEKIIASGTLRLASIEFSLPLREIYRGTPLARR